MRRYQKFTKHIWINIVFLILCSGFLVVMFDAAVGISVFPDNRENTSIISDSSNLAHTSSVGWHPLGTSALSLLERDEIVFLGVDEDDNEDFNGWAWDDHSNSYAQIKRWDNNDGASNPTIAAGELDGDGAAELIFFGTFDDGDDLKGWVYDDANHDFDSLKSWTVTDDHSKEPEVACGDIDGDGLDEIICISVDEDGEDINAWIWDDHNAGYTELKHWDNNDNVKEVNVACGDVDGDAIDEIVFLGSTGGTYRDLICWVYDDKTADFAQLKFWNDDINKADEPDVACGDIDGDGLDEIVIVSTYSEFWHDNDLKVWIWDDSAHDFAQLKHWDDWNDNTKEPHVACGDVDGDAKDEIIILSVERDGEDLRGWVCDDHDAGYEQIKHWNSDDDTESPRVATGDVDLDGKDEILFLGTDKDGEDLNGWLWDDDLNDYALLKQWDANDCTKSPVCVMADIDGDGVVVEYEGHHYEADANKVIVAVMAAPPTEMGLTQNYGASSSAFGSSYTSGSHVGNGFYQTFSASLSWSVGIPIFAEATIGGSFNQAFSRSKVTTTLLTNEITYNSGYNEDKVIYTTTKFDRYVYRIISDSYPDSGLEGTTFTVDIPIEANTHSETIEYFNANNGDEPDINIFTHNIGKVSTYPSIGDRNILAPPSGEDNEYPLLSVDGNGNECAIPVGQGTGSVSSKIDRSEDTVTSNELSLGAEATLSGKFPGGPELEVSIGAGYTRHWGTNVGSGFCFEGRVGDIDDWDEYDNFHYSFGLFVYPEEIDYYGEFYVLNYWVQDLGPGHDPPTVSYEGYVKNKANIAISSARVDVKTTEGTWVATTYTDSNGYFNTIDLTSIPDGEYQLYISKSGYNSKSISVDADEGIRRYDTTLTTISKIRVYGYVKDTYGYGLGARVTIKASNGVVIGTVTARSGDGYYSIYIDKGLTSYYRAVATFIGRSSSTYTISSTTSTQRDFTIRLPYVPILDPFF